MMMGRLAGVTALLAVVLVMTLATQPVSAVDMVEQFDPRGVPEPESNTAGDGEEPFHNLDLEKPGEVFESNFTEEYRCPACCAFAASLRRTNWDTKLHESGSGGNRRQGLHHEDRLLEVGFDALGGVVDLYVYVPARRRYAPLIYAERAGSLTEEQLIMAHKHQQVQGDQRLLDFLHNTISNEYGDETESLASRDLLKGHLDSDFAREPGSGACDPQASTACADRMNTFVILKDRARDLKEREQFATSLCKKICKKRDPRTAIPIEAEEVGVESIAQVAAREARAAMEHDAREDLRREQQRFPADPEKEDESKDNSPAAGKATTPTEEGAADTAEKASARSKQTVTEDKNAGRREEEDAKQSKGASSQGGKKKKKQKKVPSKADEKEGESSMKKANKKTQPQKQSSKKSSVQDEADEGEF